LPLDAALPAQQEVADALLDEARAIGESYGVRVIPRLIRARSFGRAVIDEARNRNSEIIVVGAERNTRRRRPMVFSEIVEYILKHAPCRVLVAAGVPFDGVRTNGHAALAVRR
jgi:nucleotide-binding universal stress UspA family protein